MLLMTSLMDTFFGGLKSYFIYVNALYIEGQNKVALQAIVYCPFKFNLIFKI